MKAADRPRPTTFAGALVVALVAYALLVHRFDFVCDDAYISFRYAKHLAAGEGLRYNLVEGQPVEGYSNFLWVLWASVAELLGVDVTVWVRVTSVACGALLVAWVMRFAMVRFGLGGLGTTAVGLFLATLPPFCVWSTGGLATVPQALFLFGVFERLLGSERPRGVQAGLLGLATALVRADGAAWVLLVLLAAAARALLSKDRALLRATLGAGAIVFAGVAVHVAWRISYYGDYLPNTARIKVGFSAARFQRGVDYLVSTFLNMLSLPFALVWSAVALRRRRGPIELTAWLVCLATLGYAVYVGGDFMAMGRFLAPMSPFLAVLVASAWTAHSGVRWKRVPAPVLLTGTAVVLSLLALFNVLLVPRSVLESFHFRLGNPNVETEYEMWHGMKVRADAWVGHGKALKALTKPGESMILGPIGAVGYYSDLIIYDTYGLTDRHVAEDAIPSTSSPGHDMAVSPRFFFPKHPTYLGYRVRPRSKPADKASIPEFRAFDDDYEIEKHPMPRGLDVWLLRMTKW